MIIKLDQILATKRIPPSLTKEVFIGPQAQIKASEVLEESNIGKEEAREPKGLPNLSNLRKKHRKSERKCWEFLKQCPRTVRRQFFE